MDDLDDVMTPFLLMRTFRAMVDAVHADLAEKGFPGIRAQHGFALQAIGEGCTSVQLGERLGVSKQAATKTAHSLEDMGLIRRERGVHDRREWRLMVSSRGRRVLQQSADGFRRVVGSWRDQVGDASVDTTLKTLAAVGAGGRTDTDLSDWS